MIYVSLGQVGLGKDEFSLNSDGELARHGVPPKGGYSVPRHRVPGGILCLGMVYPLKGGTQCLGIVYRGVFCA